MLKFVGTDGSKYYSWNLLPGTYIIGRQKEADFCIPNKTVSRKHAEVTVSPDGNQCFLRDLGSHNGTVCNGVPVQTKVELKEGDTITFGEVEFRVVDADEGVEKSKVSTTQLADYEPEKSVFLDIDEALKPLPQKITELPDVLPTLFDMAKMLVLPEPREIMLERSLKLVTKVIPAERLAVLITDNEDNDVYTAATLLTGGKDPGQFHLSRTIVNQILTQKQSILVGDPTEDPRFAQQDSIILSEMKSAMAVPLFDEDKVHGILYADTTNPLHRYTDDHLRLLATFGNIIGARMLNYTLLAERQEKQVIDAELRRASTIQKQLLIQSVPTVSGYNIHTFQDQCRAVGGDLYDIARLPDGRLLFMVADVSGKGMGAALLMANILASFRILYKQQDFDISRAVSQVSSELCDHSTPGDFATLFIGVLDSTTHEIRFINAGHNPPILLQHDGSIRHLKASGIMIGALPGYSWDEERITLSEGDVLVIFTDGVTEAEHQEEMYGEERLEKLVSSVRHLSASAIGEKLMEDIRLFVQDEPQSDDITMLILQRGR